jgi:DNA-binding GntR family transcriptional regulator
MPTKSKTPSKAPRKSLSSQVYATLLDRILSGAWKPGSLFDRRSAAKELGVSIAPVGEAMIRLEKEGFLINIPRKGTLLRPREPRKLYENLMLREAIECQAVFMAFERLPENEKKLRELAVNADVAEGKAGRAADAAFHRGLVSLAGVDTLLAQLESLSLQLMFDELVLFDSPEGKAESHDELLDALLKAKTPEAAVARLRGHLRKRREKFIGSFAKN